MGIVSSIPAASDSIRARCGIGRYLLSFACWFALLATARAQTQVWLDTNGTTGGSGSVSTTWGATTGSIWSLDSTGVSSTIKTWNTITGSTTAKNATFSAGTNATGTYTVNVSGTVDYIGGLTFEEGTVTLSGGTLNLRQNATINVSAAQATVNSVMSSTSGTFGITKTGSGILTLSGANTYTGGTTIGSSGGASGGTLRLGTSNVLPNTAFTIYAGTLDLNGASDTIGSLTLGGGASGTSATVSGNGTLTLGGNVTYDATNNPNGATISSSLALGSANRTFTIGQSTGATNDLTISGQISGSHALTKAGNGTLALTNSNTYTGATTINGGTLAISQVGALGTSSTTTASNLVLNGGTLQYTGSSAASMNRKFTVGTSGATFDSSGTGALTLSNTSAVTYSGSGNRTITLAGSNTGANTAFSVIGDGTGGATSLYKTGTGTWTIDGSNANSYTGGTFVTGGTLLLSIKSNRNATGTGNITIGDGTNSALVQYKDTANQLANTALILVNDNGTFDMNGFSDGMGGFADGMNATNQTGQVKLGSATATLQGAGTNIFSGQVSGTGGITYSGTGTQVLAGANTYSGSTSITSGTMRVANNTGLGTTAAGTSVSFGAALEISGGITVGAEALSLNGTGVSSGGALRNVSGNNTYGGLITLGGTSQINSDAGTLSLTGGITGGNSRNLTIGGVGDTSVSSVVSIGGNLLKDGTGTLTLSGANTFGGTTTLSQGTLAIGANAPSGASGALGNASSAVTVNDANTGANNTALTIATSGVTVGRDINVTNNGTGTTTLGGDSSLTSGTGAFSGNITLGDNTNLQAAGTSNITFGTGAISGTGNVTVTGGGTVTLSGNNTYTGTTTVSQGTLAIGSNAPSGSSGALGNASSAVVLNDLNTGANNTALTVATSGVTVGRAITVASNSGGGTTTIGGDTSLTSGTASYTGNLTLNSNATLQAAGTSTVSFGTGTISGTGAITKTGTGTVSLSTATTNTFSGGVTVSQGTLQAVSTSTTNSAGAFGALGTYTSLAVPTTILTVASGSTLSLQSSFTGTGSSTTQANQVMVLNGSGYNNQGALRSAGGVSTWLGQISLGSDSTITNAGVAGSGADVLYLAPWLYQNTADYLTLNNHTLTLNGSGNIAIASMIGSASGDTGSVVLTGTSSSTRYTFAGLKNYYTGSTTLNSGILRLSIDPGGIPAQGIVTSNSAILGDLTIGSGSATTTATVQLQYNDQIADTSNITINSDGTLDLGTYGAVDTVGHLIMNGGTVSTVGTNSGVLKLGGVASGNDVDASGAVASTISGQLDMNNTSGSARTFSTASGATLNVSAKVFGGSMIKDGTGTMNLTTDNFYSGTTEVKNGVLSIQSASALGQTSNGTAAAAGTTVDTGATLQLKSNSGSISYAAEAVILNGSGYNSAGAMENAAGNNTWNGGITLATNSTIKADAGTTFTEAGSITGTATTGNTQTLTVGGAGNTTLLGPISNGSGGGTLALTKVDSGTATLTNVDSFTGAVSIQAGTLASTINNALGAQTNAVNISTGATFALSGGSSFTTTVGALTGTGNVSIAASTILKANNGSADTYDGTISGSGLFEKTGSATFTFSSTANTSAFNFAGTAQLDTGTLEFKGGSNTNALTIGTMNLTGGKLLLTSAYINVGTLNITGNTILDFGTGGASVLNATNIYIAAGVTVSVVNWSSETDFLFANSSFRQNNSTGTLATFNAIGSVPENQVWFVGDPQSPDGSHTTWINSGYSGFTNWEIRPIPEPSTYGLIFGGLSLAAFAFVRSRKRE